MQDCEDAARMKASEILDEEKLSVVVCESPRCKDQESCLGLELPRLLWSFYKTARARLARPSRR